MFCVFYHLGVLEKGERRFKERRPTLQKSCGGNRFARRSAVRVSLPETPPAESAADSASV